MQLMIKVLILFLYLGLLKQRAYAQLDNSDYCKLVPTGYPFVDNIISNCTDGVLTSMVEAYVCTNNETIINPLEVKPEKYFIYEPLIFSPMQNAGSVRCSLYSALPTFSGFSESCTLSALKNNSAGFVYFGQPGFCSNSVANFGINCTSPAYCFCYYYTPTEYYAVQDHFNNTLNCTRRQSVQLSIERSSLPRLIEANNAGTTYGAESVLYTMTKGLITLKFSFVGVEHRVQIRKFDYKLTERTNDTIYNVQLPDSAMIESGDLFIDVYIVDELVFDAYDSIVGYTDCRFKHCLICWDALENWNCLSGRQQAFIIFTYLSWLVIIPCFIWICCNFQMDSCRRNRPMNQQAMMAKEPGWFSRTLFFFNFNKRKEKSEMDYSELNPLDNEETQTVTNTGGGGRKIVNKNGKWVSVTLLCCMFISTTMACDNPIIIQSKTNVCTNNVCKYTTNAKLDFPYRGAKSCFSFQAEDNSTTVNVVIVYEGMEEVINLNTLYYTAPWVFTPQRKYACWEDSVCSQAKCANVKDLGDRTAYGYLTNSLINSGYPGKVDCYREACNGWPLNRCDTDPDGCWYYSYNIAANGNPIRVMSGGSSIFKPKVSVKIWSPSSPDNTVIYPKATVTALNTTGGKKLTFNILGAYSQPSTNFADRKVMLSGSRAYLGYASSPNEPRKNNIGDIQHTSESTLFSSGYRAFIYDETMITVDENSCGPSFVKATPGAYSLSSYPHFPIDFEGNSWSYNNLSIFSNLISPKPISMNFAIEGSYSVTAERTITCPEAKFVQASGCSDCTSGSAIKLKGRSTCSAGVAQIVSDSDLVTIVTTSVFLNTTEQEFTVYLRTSEEYVEFKLSVIGSDSKVATLDISLKTYTKSELVASYGENSHDNSGNIADVAEAAKPKDAGNFFTGTLKSFFTDMIPQIFDDIFLGNATWWEYLIFAVVMGGIAIFLGVITFKVVPKFRARRMRMMRKN